MKYQDVIAKRMKEKQAEYYGNRFEKVDFGSNDHKSKEEPTTTRKELSKIAGTSESSIKRTKYILDNGTDEQIERARKGVQFWTYLLISNFSIPTIGYIFFKIFDY